MIETEAYREAKPFITTTYERGLQRGKFEAYRETSLRQLEARFGPLAGAVEQRVAELSLDQLQQLLVDLV